jgi:hypothetical protein
MSENQNSELDTTELIGLVEGTVSELKEYVRENDFSDEQLQQILSAETTSKDRKTAKKFLRRQMDNRENTSDDEKKVRNVEAEETSLSREALLQMLGGTVEDVKDYVKENNPGDNELQSLLHAEKMVKDRKTVVKFLKSYSKKKELEEDFHEAETDLVELKKDLETIEENVLEDDVELELDSIPEPENTDESSENDKQKDPEDEESEAEQGKEENAEKEKETEEEQDSESSGENEEDGSEEEESEDEETDKEEEESDEDGSEESDDEEEDLTELEKKKQILEELEMDLPEEELAQISLEELEQLRDEKGKREDLISRLSSKFDQEQLEKVTTKDLEKLDDEVGGSDEGLSKQEAQKKEEEAKRQKKKDEEQMKKEAQEDLEMMMGAVKNSGDEDNDSGPGTVDQIKQLPDKVRGILSHGEEEEEETTGFDESKTIEILEEYSEAEDREATIKTAQVMKGYLEYALGIDREMTYAELAEEMEERELESDNIETMIEFYRSMKISVYTGNVETDNIGKVIEAAKDTVKELG